MEKYEWGENIGLIDWKAHQKAWESIPPGQRFSVSKRIFGWLQTNERDFSWVPPAHPHSNCSVCSNMIETNDHIFQCANLVSRTTNKFEENTQIGGKRKECSH